jgi:hypothetical protein
LEKSEILEPLHACLREILERDRYNNPDLIKYTDEDVKAATLFFSHILGNRLYHNLVDEKVSIGLSKKISTDYAESILVLARQMSGVDMGAVRNTDKKG